MKVGQVGYTARMANLYVVATPIGNLSDTSSRAIEVLGLVDGVLAEDRRRTGILLNHFGIDTPLTSLHKHNEASHIPKVLKRLDAGQRLALVSDAGTPLLSDPGERLIQAVVEAGYSVVPVPGPSAILTSLMAAGFRTVPFTFYGFAPRKKGLRQELLEKIAVAEETSVLFESPARLALLLSDLKLLVEAQRQVVVAREMTKIHEEFFRGTMAEAASYYAKRLARGEVTIVVSPGEMEEARKAVDEVTARVLARSFLEDGLSASRTAREVSSRLGIGKNVAYEIVHSLEKGDEGSS